MESTIAVRRLAALAQDSRLAVFRLLITVGRTGMAAGEIARGLGIPANTLSAHLSILANAGLVVSRREGRSIIYSADFDGMGELLSFLVEDCCAGSPEICAPVAEAANRVVCCP